ncbi:MAG: hypothetical protein EXR72_13720 [Myxococcales bacterium]|nr:hypothetical protein [Myxococcales bacterium]
MTFQLTRNTRIAAAIYLFSLAAYASTSAGRLRRHSDDNHFVWLAHGWLHGRLDLGQPPPSSNDWAQVEWITLNNGQLLKGAMVKDAQETFRTLRGEILTVKPDTIAKRQMKYYVSFPPFPALLMAPAVAIWGLETNDVLFSVLIAGLAPALLFLLLRRMAGRGDSQRSESDDLWLTAILGIGSVFFYSAVLGQVWYTAHIVSVILVVLYVHASIDARYPFLAGLCVVTGFLCRPEILFAAPFFAWELLRVHSVPETDETRSIAERGNEELFTFLDQPGWWRYPLAPPLLLWRILRRVGLHVLYAWKRADRGVVLKKSLYFALPIAALGLVAAGLNVARFGRPTEFGHTYLNVRWTPRIQKYGLFNYTFLGRNLACMLALTPKVINARPYVQSSWHGLALWVTTPALLFLLWPSVKGRLHRPLWLTTAFVAIPDLLYQNSGWVQFGYRFSLDYMVFLVLLLAIGGRPLTRWFKVLVIVGVVVNLFGAITFGRMPWFFYDGFFPPGID